MRYFLAIPLLEETKQKLHKINSELSEFKDLKFVNPDNMHLTLLFLGENNAEEKIKELKKIKFKPFKIKTEKISTFPEEGKIRLVWVTLKESKELMELQRKISKLFNIKKEFKPHITLARIKRIDKKHRAELENKIKNMKLNNITINVNNFKLYSSELTVLGPVHRVVEYFEADKKK